MDVLTICSILVVLLVLPGVLILFLRPALTLKLIVWFLRHSGSRERRTFPIPGRCCWYRITFR